MNATAQPIRNDSTTKTVKLYSTLGSCTFQFLASGRVYIPENMSEMSAKGAERRIRDLRSLGWTETDPWYTATPSVDRKELSTAARKVEADAKASPIKTVEQEDGSVLLTIKTRGMKLTYGAKLDARILDVSDNKIQTKTERGASELAREINAWGNLNARAFGYAVVFW